MGELLLFLQRGTMCLSGTAAASGPIFQPADRATKMLGKQSDFSCFDLQNIFSFFTELPKLLSLECSNRVLRVRAVGER